MKRIVLILLSIDFLIFLFILIFTPPLFIPHILINVIFLIIFFKLHFNINIINIEKVKNIIKTHKIRKKISKEEKYLDKLHIRTFDGSNSTTHPCIMYFEKPFNKYKYYMVHTPYDNHNIEFENPSICMSNDGINFIKPKNIKDPLLPIIKRGENKIAKYYSDNFLFYDKNKLQIWYRYTEEDKSCKPFKLKNKIFRITTEDAINYTKPELILSDDEIWYLSPSIVKINDSYYLYYFDKDLKLYTKTSNNLKKWSSPKLVTISNFNNNCWHGEVKLIKNKLYLLLLSKDYKLYFCQTDKSSPTKFNTFNEIHFNYYDKNHIYGNTHPYKSTFLINNGFIDLYIPFAVNIINHFRLKGIRRIKWTMTYTHIKNSTYNKYIKN